MSGSKEQKVPTEPAVAETPEKEPVPAADAKKPAEKGAEKTAANAETKPEKKGRRRRRRNRKKGKKDTKDGENADTSDGDKDKDKEKPQDYVLQPVKKKKSPAAPRKNKQRGGGQGGRGRGRGRRRGGGRGYFNYHGPGRPFPPYMYPPHHGMHGPPRGYPGYPPQMAGNYLPCDYEAVKRQLEFYFGEINLARDQFIRSHMDAQGFVPAYVMSGFPRMRNGMITPGEILHAASRSPLLDIRNGCIRSKRLWKRFANDKVQASLIQNLQKGLGVGDEVRPHGDDIPEGFGDKKCVIKKKIDNGRKSLIARADDPERCVIVVTAQLSAWSMKEPKKAPKAVAEGDKDDASASKEEGSSASKQEGGDKPEASQE